MPLVREYDCIGSILEKTKKTCCFCCSCESSTGAEKPWPSTCCSGCTRRLCFGNLCILAFASGKESTVTANAKSIPVPVIYLDEADQPIPQKVFKWRQLLVYHDRLHAGSVHDDDNMSFCLFRSKTSNSKSFFSREVLERLTHASVVLEVISKERAEKSRSAEAPILEEGKQRFPGPDAITDEAETTYFKWAPCFHLGPFLFIRQLLSSSCSPLLTFAKSYKRHRLAFESKKRSCNKCGKLEVLDKSNYEKVEDFTTTFNTMIISIVDVAVGVLLGAMCIVRFDDSVGIIVDDWIKGHYELLQRSLDWLERFPIGFKLNVRLTQSMGKGIRTLVSVHEGMLYGLGSQLCKSIKPSAGLVIFGVGLMFGASGLIALLSDVIWLAFGHISCLDFCFRQIYSNELYLLRSLWRLFRGKKRNILRHRTDTMEYDSTQLLLGTIMFTIALFLWTTVAVYHSFFALLNLLVLSLTIILSNAHLLLRRFPWGSLWLCMKKPHWFIADVHIEDMSLSTDGIDSTRLRVVATAISALISNELMAPTKELIASIGSFLVVSFTGQGR